MSSIGRNDSGFCGSPPLTAISAGAAARGRSLRVVNDSTGLAGRFCAPGSIAAGSVTWYVVPGSSAGAANRTPVPSGVAVAVAATGPLGPVIAHSPSAACAIASENDTTTLVPIGTSTWASVG